MLSQFRTSFHVTNRRIEAGAAGRIAFGREVAVENRADTAAAAVNIHDQGAVDRCQIADQMHLLAEIDGADAGRAPGVAQTFGLVFRIFLHTDDQDRPVALGRGGTDHRFDPGALFLCQHLADTAEAAGDLHVMAVAGMDMIAGIVI